MGTTTILLPILLITKNQLTQGIINILIVLGFIIFSWLSLSFNMIFGIISLSFSLLFVNVILLLLSGWSVIGFDPARHVLDAMMSDSFLSIQFVKYYGIFFALPALVLMFSVLLYAEVKDEEEEE